MMVRKMYKKGYVDPTYPAVMEAESEFMIGIMPLAKYPDTHILFLGVFWDQCSNGLVNT